MASTSSSTMALPTTLLLPRPLRDVVHFLIPYFRLAISSCITLLSFYFPSLARLTDPRHEKGAVSAVPARRRLFPDQASFFLESYSSEGAPIPCASDARLALAPSADDLSFEWSLSIQNALKDPVSMGVPVPNVVSQQSYIDPRWLGSLASSNVPISSAASLPRNTAIQMRRGPATATARSKQRVANVASIAPYETLPTTRNYRAHNSNDEFDAFAESFMQPPQEPAAELPLDTGVSTADLWGSFEENQRVSPFDDVWSSDGLSPDVGDVDVVPSNLVGSAMGVPTRQLQSQAFLFPDQSGRGAVGLGRPPLASPVSLSTEHGFPEFTEFVPSQQQPSRQVRGTSLVFGYNQIPNGRAPANDTYTMQLQQRHAQETQRAQQIQQIQQVQQAQQAPRPQQQPQLVQRAQPQPQRLQPEPQRFPQKHIALPPHLDPSELVSEPHLAKGRPGYPSIGALHDFTSPPSSHRSSSPSPYGSPGVNSLSPDIPTNERFRCPHCDADFRIKGYLTRHMKKHAERKAYTCPFYDPLSKNPCHPTGGFSRRDTYKTHLKSRHFTYPPNTKCSSRNSVPGSCCACDEKFTSNEEWVEKHIQTRSCPALNGDGVIKESIDGLDDLESLDGLGDLEKLERLDSLDSLDEIKQEAL